MRGIFRKLFFNSFVSGVSYRDIIADDFMLRCHYADNSTDRNLCIYGAAKNAAEMSMLMGCLKPGDTFVDVGANSGWFTVNAARAVGPTGFILAIEPQAIMIERLRFNIITNGYQDRVVVSPYAVSDEPGRIVMRVNLKQRGRSGVSEHCGTEERSITATTLPDLLSTMKQPAALKIDIEGHEDRALLPIVRKLSPEKWPRNIFLETVHAGRWSEPCVEILCSNGYAVKWQGEHDALLTLGV